MQNCKFVSSKRMGQISILNFVDMVRTSREHSPLNFDFLNQRQINYELFVKFIIEGIKNHN